jgi:hypothetical protein
MVDNLPPSRADVTESGILNLPEPSEPHRPVIGLLTFTFTEGTVTFRATPVTPFMSHLMMLEQSVETVTIRHPAGDLESFDTAAVLLAAVSSRGSAFVFFVFRLASYKLQGKT